MQAPLHIELFPTVIWDRNAYRVYTDTVRKVSIGRNRLQKLCNRL